MTISVNDQLNIFEQQSGGVIGVCAKHIESGVMINYRKDEPFFMASTLKLPLTITLLQKIENGLLALDDMIQYRALNGSCFL